MGSRLEKLDAATDSKGNVKVLLTYKVPTVKHVRVIKLNLSARFMRWFMQAFRNSAPYTDVTIYVDDIKYKEFLNKKDYVITNVTVPKRIAKQRELDHEQYPNVPLFKKTTGFTEIKDYAMPNLRTEWMKLHS